MAEHLFQLFDLLLKPFLIKGVSELSLVLPKLYYFHLGLYL